MLIPGPCLNYFMHMMLHLDNNIPSKANKKKESEGRAGGASGSKSAQSSPSSLKKEQAATATGKKVYHYVIIFGSMPIPACISNFKTFYCIGCQPQQTAGIYKCSFG